MDGFHYQLVYSLPASRNVLIKTTVKNAESVSM